MEFTVKISTDLSNEDLSLEQQKEMILNSLFGLPIETNNGLYEGKIVSVDILDSHI